MNHQKSRKYLSLRHCTSLCLVGMNEACINEVLWGLKALLLFSQFILILDKTGVATSTVLTGSFFTGRTVRLFSSVLATDQEKVISDFLDTWRSSFFWKNSVLILQNSWPQYKIALSAGFIPSFIHRANNFCLPYKLIVLFYQSEIMILLWLLSWPYKPHYILSTNNLHSQKLYQPAGKP